MTRADLACALEVTERQILYWTEEGLLWPARRRRILHYDELQFVRAFLIAKMIARGVRWCDVRPTLYQFQDKQLLDAVRDGSEAFALCRVDGTMPIKILTDAAGVIERLKKATRPMILIHFRSGLLRWAAQVRRTANENQRKAEDPPDSRVLPTRGHGPSHPWRNVRPQVLGV